MEIWLVVGSGEGESGGWASGRYRGAIIAEMSGTEGTFSSYICRGVASIGVRSTSIGVRATPVDTPPRGYRYYTISRYN